MIPSLYDISETSFGTNGLGFLPDAISCKVVEERNGEYELSMEYPPDGLHASELSYGRIIRAIPHDGGTMQAFRIYKVEKGMIDQIVVSARHITYDLVNMVVLPFDASGLSGIMSILPSRLVYGRTPTGPLFRFSADFNQSYTWNQEEPIGARAFLGDGDESILGVFGTEGTGEFEWDNYNIIFHQNRGSKTGVTLRYGKNIIDLDQEVNIEDTVTTLIPYWKTRSDKRNITVTGDPVQGTYSSSFPLSNVKTADVTSKIKIEGDDADKIVPSVRDVTQAGVYKIAEEKYLGIPMINIKVSFVALWQTEEYKDIAPLEHVKLCDIVNVVFERLGISEIAKVVKTDYDVLNDRYNSIEIGDIKKTTFSYLKDQEVVLGQKIDQVSTAVDAEATNRTSGDNVLTANLGQEIHNRVQMGENLSTTITQTAQQIRLEAEDKEKGLRAAIQIQADRITSEVTRAQKAEGDITTSMSSKIEQTAESITATVNKEVTRAQNAEQTIRENYKSEIKQSADSITSTVAATYTTKDQFGITTRNLESRITQNADLISTKVSTSDFSSMMVQSASSITLYADQILLRQPIPGVVALYDLTETLYAVSRNALEAEDYAKKAYYQEITLRSSTSSKNVTSSDSFTFIDSLAAGSFNNNERLDFYIQPNYTMFVGSTTSDARLKTTTPIFGNVENFYMSLDPIEYDYNEGVYSGSDSLRRHHFGLVAQNVQRALQDNGFLYDNALVTPYEPMDSLGETRYVKDGTAYKIIYDELHAFHVKMIQKHQNDIQQLKMDLANAKAEIDILKEELKNAR